MCRIMPGLMKLTLRLPAKFDLNALLPALSTAAGASISPVMLAAAFGKDVIASYLKLRHDEWNAYSRHLTDWERQTTLDC